MEELPSKNEDLKPNPSLGLCTHCLPHVVLLSSISFFIQVLKELAFLSLYDSQNSSFQP